jgi:RNA polymerase sigma-70 factor (ECF subfamily)
MYPEDQLPDLNDMEESALLVLAATGDRDAFSVLYQKYVNRIYSYIYYRTGNDAEAEDLTERVFMRAYAHINRYVDRGVPFSAWLYRIAHNLIANWHRDNSRRKEVPLEEHYTSPRRSDHPELQLVDTQEMESLLEAIRALPQERQQLVVLKFVEKLSNSEIAVIMGRSEGAIKSLYHRTLLSLRDELEKKRRD